MSDKEKLDKHVSEKKETISREEILEKSNKIQKDASMKRMENIRASRNRSPLKRVNATKNEDNDTPPSTADEADRNLKEKLNNSNITNNQFDEDSLAHDDNNTEKGSKGNDEIGIDESKKNEQTHTEKESNKSHKSNNTSNESSSMSESQPSLNRPSLDNMKKQVGNDDKTNVEGDNQSRFGQMGDSLKKKLSSSSNSSNEKESTTSKTVDKTSKAVREAQKVAQATNSVFSALTSLIFNPITWVALGIILIGLSVMAGSQILGKSDFAKNCNSSGDLEVSVDMPKDELERANVVATWLTSNKFEFMGGKPMTVEQAAGIVGNWSQEGGIMPTAFQPNSVSDPDYYKSCDNECVLALGSVGGRATGFMQWDSGRRVNLVNHAKSLNKPWHDANVQLDFLRLEADGAEKASYMKNFANCKDAESCAIAFCNDVERAGKPEMQNRVAFAKKFVKEFKPTSGGSIGDASSSGNVSSCSADDSVSMDASGLVELAVSIAYPTSEYSKSNVSGGDSYGQSNALPGYKKAKELAEKNGGKDPMPGLFASCDRFVATVLKATKTDTEVPWGSTTEQYNYFKSSPKWKEVKCQDRKPGDVIITKSNGHVMLYLGNVKGQDSLASASYLDRVAAVGPFTGCSGDDWLADGWPMNGIGTTGFRAQK